MAFDTNRVTLIGRLGKDPELRTTSGGKKVASFSMATGYRYKDGEDWKEIPTWHNIVLWNKMAEQAMSAAKGVRVFVEGRVTNRSYDNKEGVKIYVTEVIADKFEIISTPSKSKNEPADDDSSSRGGSYDRGGPDGSGVPF